MEHFLLTEAVTIKFDKDDYSAVTRTAEMLGCSFGEAVRRTVRIGLDALKVDIRDGTPAAGVKSRKRAGRK